MQENTISQVAVIGAGTMGTQVALLLAISGYKVQLIDIAQEALAASLAKMKEDLRMIRLLSPGMGQVSESCLEQIYFSATLETVTGSQLIIENIKEDETLKKELYTQLVRYIRRDTILAVNTSCIPIASIAAIVPWAGQVIGVHFMNPVYLKNLVEVIKTPLTSAETIETTGSFLRSLKKKFVVVRDSPGFVANRLSHLLMNEAAWVIHEQLCGPDELDLIFKTGYGHAMGPLETADLIGVDTVVDSLKVLEQNMPGEKFRCCPLLTDMVEKGSLGRKTGQGFYSYK